MVIESPKRSGAFPAASYLLLPGPGLPPVRGTGLSPVPKGDWWVGFVRDYSFKGNNPASSNNTAMYYIVRGALKS